MIVPRNTTEITPLTYLDCIHRGSTADWRRLYALCRDPEVASIVATLLPMRDPDLLPSACLWRFLLEDLHPNLHQQIDLHPGQRDIGV